MNNGKICVSICAETADAFIEKIKVAADIADVIELRFDLLDYAETEKLLLKLKQIKKNTSKPFLAAMHNSAESKIEGETLHLGAYNIWSRILASNVVDYFDPFQNEISKILLEEWSRKKSKSKIVNDAKNHIFIYSHHSFSKTPKNLELIFDQMIETPAQIVKIAVQANKATDTIAIWNLLNNAKTENKKLIPIAMGEAGKWTRILGLAFGSPITYASLDDGNETAPGQISAKDLIEVYRVKELNEQTEIYGIIGNPVSHSLSPYMHNAAFKHHNLNAVYIPFEVANLDEFIKRMVRPETREIDWNLKGFSVTIPHKEAIIKHLDFIDEDAKTIGAVNTVKIIDGKLHGYNTDAHGFIEPLRNSYGELNDTRVGIIGNGGAARACVYALKKEGANVTIFARNVKNAESIATEFNVNLEEIKALDSSNSALNLLVNTTPLGTMESLKMKLRRHRSK